MDRSLNDPCGITTTPYRSSLPHVVEESLQHLLHLTIDGEEEIKEPSTMEGAGLHESGKPYRAVSLGGTKVLIVNQVLTRADDVSRTSASNTVNPELSDTNNSHGIGRVALVTLVVKRVDAVSVDHGSHRDLREGPRSQSRSTPCPQDSLDLVPNFSIRVSRGTRR
jgi:hypothetical protein